LEARESKIVMKITDLKVGMLLDGRSRRHDFCENMRVEFVAYDWAVARKNNGHPVFLESDESFELYKEPTDE
jgi:hypothetical protein